MAKAAGRPGVADHVHHGAPKLPGLTVEAYSLDVRDRKGYFGDKASNSAFRELVDSIREELRRHGDDPIDASSDDVSRKFLDRLIAKGTVHQTGVVLSAVEAFSQNLASVIGLLMKQKPWNDVRKVVVGGGFRNSRVGEFVIGRTDVLLRTNGMDVDLFPIRHHPDEAGLIGCAHLAPSWMFKGHDAVIGIDIGGSNFRCGIVTLNLSKKAGLAKAEVTKSELWRHADDEPGRKEALKRLGEMLGELLDAAKNEKIRLAPFIGIGCPGTVLEDGTLEGGTLNLPGDWGARSFNLVEAVRGMVPSIGGHETMVILHNDAVIQGLSQAPFMTDEKAWGVVTIGTGLGNACFRNRVEKREDQ